MWTRKRTVIAGRTDGDKDWEVLKDGRQVGRIYATMLPDVERSWMWFVQVGRPEQGYAGSLDEALYEIRRRFG